MYKNNINVCDHKIFTEQLSSTLSWGDAREQVEAFAQKYNVDVNSIEISVETEWDFDYIEMRVYIPKTSEEIEAEYNILAKEIKDKEKAELDRLKKKYENA